MSCNIWHLRIGDKSYIFTKCPHRLKHEGVKKCVLGWRSIKKCTYENCPYKVDAVPLKDW